MKNFRKKFITTLIITALIIPVAIQTHAENNTDTNESASEVLDDSTIETKSESGDNVSSEESNPSDTIDKENIESDDMINDETIPSEENTQEDKTDELEEALNPGDSVTVYNWTEFYRAYSKDIDITIILGDDITSTGLNGELLAQTQRANGIKIIGNGNLLTLIDIDDFFFFKKNNVANEVYFDNITVTNESSYKPLISATADNMRFKFIFSNFSTGENNKPGILNAPYSETEFIGGINNIFTNYQYGIIHTAHFKLTNGSILNMKGNSTQAQTIMISISRYLGETSQILINEGSKLNIDINEKSLHSHGIYSQYKTNFVIDGEDTEVNITGSSGAAFNGMITVGNESEDNENNRGSQFNITNGAKVNLTSYN